MLKNLLPVKCTLLLINGIQGFISSYHRLMRQLHFNLKQDSFLNYQSNYYLPKCAKDNAFIVACIRYCLHQQECDIYH